MRFLHENVSEKVRAVWQVSPMGESPNLTIVSARM